MIRNFRHRGLQELYTTGKSRKIGGSFTPKFLFILDLLLAADTPDDMDIVGLRLHALQGKPKRYSVRVNHNYRITFGWVGDAAIDIDLEDYH